MYEVDYFDGLSSSLSAHVIAVNLITQNNDEGINSNNPILDTPMYEVDYLWSSLSAYVNAVN